MQNLFQSILSQIKAAIYFSFNVLTLAALIITIAVLFYTIIQTVLFFFTTFITSNITLWSLLLAPLVN